MKKRFEVKRSMLSGNYIITDAIEDSGIIDIHKACAILNSLSDEIHALRIAPEIRQLRNEQACAYAGCSYYNSVGKCFKTDKCKKLKDHCDKIDAAIEKLKEGVWATH